VTDTTLPVGTAAMAHSSASKQSTDQAEHALLACISADDRAAMDKLYLLYFARLAKFFLHLTVHVHLVEELINDTMFDVWQKGASIVADVSVAVTIMGLAYSRGQKRVAEASATIRLHVKPATQYADQDGPWPATLESSSILQDFLLNLPVEERVVLHLVYAGGHSRRDIAYIMNISCECVDVLFGDGRHRLDHVLGHVGTGNRD
jgi:DNA-directed RNA polymerase specialized sigma24 family protein